MNDLSHLVSRVKSKVAFHFLVFHTHVGLYARKRLNPCNSFEKTKGINRKNLVFHIF